MKQETASSGEAREIFGWKNEMRRVQQAEHSAIRFLQLAEAFCRVAAQHVHARATRFVSRQSTGGQRITGQHANYFHNPRILSNTVPLGFCFGGFSSTAGYAPATKLNFR